MGLKNKTEDLKTQELRRKLILGGLAAPALALFPWGGSHAQAAQQNAWEPPRIALLDYEMVGYKGRAISGTGSLDWFYLPDQGNYSLELNITALLLSFLYASKGRYDKELGFFPDTFREKRVGKDRTVHFDYPSEDLIWSWKARDQAWPLIKDTQDITSVMLQISSLIAKSPQSMKAGHLFSFPIARMGSVKFWDFKIIDRPAVETKLGYYPTWHINRELPEDDTDLQVEFWLAPDLHYMPVKMSFNSRDGSYLRVTLNKIRNFVV